MVHDGPRSLGGDLEEFPEGLQPAEDLFGRDLFWMVVQQVVVFALTAVFLKAVLGFIVAHLVNNLPQKGQRKWRGMMLVPWVIPPVLSTLGWWWMFDPTYSAFNWVLAAMGGVALEAAGADVLLPPDCCLPSFRCVLRPATRSGASPGSS